MKKSIFLYCLFLWSSVVFAKDYSSEHFITISEADPCFVQFVQLNAEAYYDYLEQNYFRQGWQQPVIIHFLETQSQIHRLIDEHGHGRGLSDWKYMSSIPMIYAYRLNDNGDIIGWQRLFSEIACHFIPINYPDAPDWFNQALVKCLADNADIVKDRVFVDGFDSPKAQVLSDKVAEDIGSFIKKLFCSQPDSNSDANLNILLAQSIFYWLEKNNQLDDYLKSAKKQGYDFSVLKESTGKSYGQIKSELLQFIQDSSVTASYINVMKSDDEKQKKQSLLTALSIKPDCAEIKFELAKSCYSNKDYSQSRAYLSQIMNNPQSRQYRQAAVMAANIYYKEKDFNAALEYYMKAWDYSNYYEDRYRQAYQIANCYYHIDDSEKAGKWYQVFLDARWDKTKMADCAEYARKYLDVISKSVDTELQIP